MPSSPLRGHGATALCALVVVVLAGAGLVWRECLMLGVAVCAGYRLFLWRMDIGAPWDGWRAGIWCLLAGTLGLAASMAVVVALVAAMSDVWPVSHDHVAPALAAIAAAGVVISTLQAEPRNRLTESGIWGALLVGAVIALDAARAGYGWVPCVLTAALATWLAWRSWRLASAAHELFHAA